MQFGKLGISMSVFLLLVSPRAEGTIHTISVGNNFFSPLGTTVQHGDTVRWIWVGGLIPHNSTSRPDSPKSWASATTSQSFFTFDIQITAADGPGPFPYLCTVHPFTMRDTLHVNLPPEPTIFAFRLDSKQAANCAGSGTGNSGYGLGILSPDSSELSLHLYHNVASVTLADVHRGAPCQSGPILFVFDNLVGHISQTFALTPTDVSDLFAGNLYIDVHSAPGFSEDLRGQIVQEPLNMIYTLDESQAAMGAGTGSLANGIGVGTLSADGLSFTSTISHNVANVTEAHIHNAAPGVDGPIQIGFADPVSITDEVWALDTTDIMNLFAGDLYANVHSALFPTGEIRGQIAPTGGVFVTTLDGVQAGTTSDATGFCVATLSPDQCTLSIHCEHDVANVTEGHVHRGAPGVSGPSIFGFPNVNSPFDAVWTLSPQDLQDFINGNLYVNIHSSAFILGEIRGQLILDERQTFAFSLDESQSNNCNGTGSSALGDATIELAPGGKQLNTMLTHDVTNVTEAHIHQGDPCVVSPVVFGFADPTSPIEDIWRLGTADVIALMQGQLYANIHSNAFPIGEIRGQIENAAGCCIGSTGNIDNDPQDIADIADLTFLIDNLFINFTAIPCPEEGNIDGDSVGVVDIADLTFLIDNLFINFTPTSPCR